MQCNCDSIDSCSSLSEITVLNGSQLLYSLKNKRFPLNDVDNYVDPFKLVDAAQVKNKAQVPSLKRQKLKRFNTEELFKGNFQERKVFGIADVAKTLGITVSP